MEEITLEKIDVIRQRTGLSYAEAKELLEKNNGNVVDTLIYIENNQKSFTQNISDFSNDLLDTIKDIIKKGNVNRIRIKKDEKVLIDIPVSAGLAAGALSLFYPSILAIGAIAAVASRVQIEIERPDGSVELVNDLVKTKAEDIRDKAKETVEDIKGNFDDNTKQQ